MPRNTQNSVNRIISSPAKTNRSHFAPKAPYKPIKNPTIIPFFSHISCDITTLDDFLQLALGEIGHDCDTLMIDQSAMEGTESVLAQPVNFATAPFDVITFRAGDRIWKRNTIHMYPRKQAIGAEFQSGHILVRGLPTNYTDYEIVFGGRTALSVGDLKAIFRWSSAKRLAIYDEAQHDMAQKLARKADHLSELYPELEEITVILHDHTYEAVKIEEFLTQLPALRLARFQFSQHVPSDVSETYALQVEVPEGWTVDVQYVAASHAKVVSILCTKTQQE